MSIILRPHWSNRHKLIFTVTVGHKYVNVHRHQLLILSKINYGWSMTVTVLQCIASTQQIGLLLVPAIKGAVYINAHCNYSKPELTKLYNENIGGHPYTFTAVHCWFCYGPVVILSLSYSVAWREILRILCSIGTSRKRETGCQGAKRTRTSRETKTKRTAKEGERRGTVAEARASARRQEEKTRVCNYIFVGSSCDLYQIPK